MAEKEAERLRKEQLEHAERLAEEIKLEEQKREHRLRAEREKKKAKEDLLETEMTDDPMVEHFGHKICFSPGGPSFDTVRLGSARSGMLLLICSRVSFSITTFTETLIKYRHHWKLFLGRSSHGQHRHASACAPGASLDSFQHAILQS